MPPKEGRFNLGSLKRGNLGIPTTGLKDIGFGAPYDEELPEGCLFGLKRFAMVLKNKGDGEADI